MKNGLISDDLNGYVTSESRYSDACENYAQIKNLNNNNNLISPLISNLNKNSYRKNQEQFSNLFNVLDDNIIEEEKEENISSIYSTEHKINKNVCILSTTEEKISNLIESDLSSKNNSNININRSIKKKSRNDDQKILKNKKNYNDSYNDVSSFGFGKSSYNALLNEPLNKNSELLNLNENINNINIINENETNNSNMNINNELRNRESISTNHMTKQIDINTNKNNIINTSNNSIANNDENNINNISNLDDEIEKNNNIIETEDNLSINKVKFIDFKQDEIDINFLKTKLRKIQVYSKNIKHPKNKYIRCLIELQNFYIDDSSIWVIKLNHDGNYLAAGCQSGKIKIFRVINYKYENFENSYDKDNILNYCNFICQNPYKTLKGHKSDIIDLSWSPFFPNLLLSASLDYFIILWDISLPEGSCQINKYEHSDMVTCVDFNPVYENIFISGCLDTFVRQWLLDYNKNSNSKKNENKGLPTAEESYKGFIIGSANNNNINNNKNNNKFSFMSLIKFSKNKKNPTIDKNLIDYFNVAQKITAVSYFPDGSKIAIGTERGKIYIYNTFPKITYIRNFDCKNKLGRFRSGRKITNIEFFDKDSAIITTTDSRLRYVTMPEGKLIHKYKGYVNKNKMVRTYSDLCNDIIISGSEDGNCYIWSLFNLENNSKKNYHYEYFKPFSKDIIECSIIVPEKCYTNYMQKIFKLTNKLLIISIIINATSGGRLEVLLNIDDHYRE